VGKWNVYLFAKCQKGKQHEIDMHTNNQEQLKLRWSSCELAAKIELVITNSSSLGTNAQ